MSVGIITGSGTHALPGYDGGEPVAVETPFGITEIVRGRFAGVEALHLSRHGAGHVRLSNQVAHRANIWALNELRPEAVIGCTACGAVDATLAPGSLVVFDDLHFIANRSSGCRSSDRITSILFWLNLLKQFQGCDIPARNSGSQHARCCSRRFAGESNDDWRYNRSQHLGVAYLRRISDHFEQSRRTGS